MDMKKLLVYITVCLLCTAFWSCNEKEKKYKPGSIGSAYELVLVCDNARWEGALGDTLRSILLEPVEHINSYEPIFDVYRIINLTDLHRKNRNIMVVTVDPEYTEPFLVAQYDVYAQPQIVINLAGPDNETVISYISEYRENLTNTLEAAERDRDMNYNRQHGDKNIPREIYDKFGVEVELPYGYKVRNTLDDFMWISFEYPTASQGVIIYSYPYTDRENFTVDSLLYYRNKFTALIPGENPGSHMTTYTYEDYKPELTHLRLDNGRYWAEMRGFWDVEGDYMGGPFVSYSTLDTDTRRVVTFDFYVFSPDKPKRNYLRQLEHLIYAIRFPSDATAVAVQ